MPVQEGEKPTRKPFRTCESGFVHIDVKYLPQMSDEIARRHLFVAIDRATRWVYVAIKPDEAAASAKTFLNVLCQACPASSC